LALKQFDGDVPNLRIVHYTVLAAAFRFVLRGTGAILSGLNAWSRGRSNLEAVWHPYSTTSQGQEPLDPNTYRVIEEPTLTVLELLELSPSSGVLRLEFLSPHVVDAADVNATSVDVDYVDALNTLTAVKILELAAIRAAQNTGNTGIPTDVVDRRSQSSEFAARAKSLLSTYQAMVGRSEDGGAAGATRDLDVAPSYLGLGAGNGFLWHPRRTR
jgi:hypothetical protein